MSERFLFLTLFRKITFPVTIYMHGQSHMNQERHGQVLACRNQETPLQSKLQCVVADDIYKRRDQEIVKLEQMRLRFAYNTHRHTNEHILFWCGITGSLIAALDVYYHFAKFNTGMKEISEWSSEHMITIKETVSSLQFQSYNNAFITGYNHMIELLSFGSTIPSGMIYVFSGGLYSLSQVGAMLTAYIIFLILLLLNILVLQIYTRGLYLYAFGTGVIIRDTETQSRPLLQNRYQLCNQPYPQTPSSSHTS